MTGLLKFAYILIGAGIGIIGSSFILEYELEKPIGEIENYIPQEDRDAEEINPESGSLDSRNSEDSAHSSESYSASRGNGDGRGRSESGSHSEFGASQADLYHFYSSNEDRLRNSGRKESGTDGKAGEGSTEDSAKSEMSESDRQRAEFEKRRMEAGVNQRVKYSKMYQYITKGLEYSDNKDEGGDSMDDILHQVNVHTNTRESYLQDEETEDDPELSPFELNIHQMYKLEWIEGPFEIFLEECPLCESIPLTYYQGDYTLCDDGEQIIPDPEDVVGMAALNRLIEGGPGVINGEVIYVHNTKTGINYEVMLEPGTYKESVAGLIDEKFSGSSI